MLLIDKPGTGRSVSRFDAVDIGVFTRAVEYGYALHQGVVYYGVTIVIDGNLYGAVFDFGDSTYSQDHVSEGIVQLYADLASEGVIGHENLAMPSTATMTGNPLGDLLQVADAMMRPEGEMIEAVVRRYAATHSATLSDG